MICISLRSHVRMTFDLWPCLLPACWLIADLPQDCRSSNPGAIYVIQDEIVRRCVKKPRLEQNIADYNTKPFTREYVACLRLFYHRINISRLRLLTSLTPYRVVSSPCSVIAQKRTSIWKTCNSSRRVSSSARRVYTPAIVKLYRCYSQYNLCYRLFTLRKHQSRLKVKFS